MSCSIKTLYIESLSKKGAVDGRNIINELLFNKLNEEQRNFDKEIHKIKNPGLPFTSSKSSEVKNITNSAFERLNNNRYSLTWTANEEYFKELQSIIDSNQSLITDQDELNEIYSEENSVDSDYQAIVDFRKLVESGEITQFCSR
jgi:hypothetical protein